MALETDLNTSPYYDDYDESKEYYRVLFKPGVAVQTRELNQLQTILQKQVERFGDNIFKQGTIVDGCSFTYYDYYPYVKLVDSQTDGQPVLANSYVGMFVKNSSNLVAYVLDSKTGYESQDPDLNTLYLRYINSGNTFDQTSFSNAQILTVFNSNNSIFNTTVNNGGVGFSNTDQVIYLSSMVVSVASSNTFSNGELITQATTNARAIIVETNNTVITNALVLKLKPLTADLANTAANTSAWEFSEGYSITSNTTSSVANVTQIIGTGATASLVTDSLGVVQTVSVLDGGNNYIVSPYTTIKPISNTASINDLSLTTQNYKCQVTISTLANSVGSGYAFGVSDGVIYQKGFFLYVDPQTIVVQKYNNQPDQVVVGFDTSELLVNNSIDESLLDNSTGTFNSQAPGADRLKLVPNLIVLDKASAEANDKFFAITEFSDGLPFKQNRQTAYNLIEDEMAQRTSESSGDYVIDPFLIMTKSIANDALEANTFKVIVDPGHAYINGFRVKTDTNFALTSSKGVDTQLAPDTSISLNYENYILVNELGGTFLFTTGDLVSLRDTAKQYVTNTSNITSATILVAGNEIGTARARSLIYDSGTPGTASAVYRLYLFDINMNPGQNFRNVRSVYYNGATFQGIADIKLTLDPTTSSNIATIVNSNSSQLLFNIGADSIKNANNIKFIYRALNSNAVSNTSGIISLSISASGETLPYDSGATLSTTQQAEVIVVPLANTQANSNLAGTFSGNTTSNVIIAATENLITALNAGDYVKLTDGSNTAVKRIQGVINSTAASLDSNLAFVTAVANAVVFFPHHVPVSVASHPSRSINVNSSQNILTINLGTNLNANTPFAIVYNTQVTNATQATKTVNRGSVVKLNISNNSANTKGPWVLGVSDIFRLNSVYLNSNVANISSADTDVTNEFYIDHNQGTDFYDTGYLYLKPNSSLVLANTNALLVNFDNFTSSSNTLFTFKSYSVDDTKSLADLQATSSINSQEIPEVFTSKGSYYDLINSVDFRLVVSNTANITSNSAAVTINPAAPTTSAKFGNTASPANAVRFPVPGSIFTSDIEKYLGRSDLIIVTDDGQIKSVKGVPSTNNFALPAKPDNSLVINSLNIPAYPSNPIQKSANLVYILDKKIANEKYSYKRDSDHTITISKSQSNVVNLQPTRYSMEDITRLEKRIASLEYYVTLTQLETEIKDRIIPSSTNPSLNRFKYGFFADSFVNTDFTDFNNPEYSATIVADEVVPLQNQLNLPYKFNRSDSSTNALSSGKMILFPYASYDLITQLNATDGPVPANPVIPDPTANPTQTTVCSYKAFGQNQAQVDEYLLSSTSGTATMVWNDGYPDSSDGFKVYQGTSPGFSIVGKTPIKTSADGVTPSADQERKFLAAGGPSPDFYGIRSIPSSWGAFTITYNVANGRYIKIVPNTIPRNGWFYQFCYPTDSTSVVIPPPITPAPTNKYVGTLVADPPVFKLTIFPIQGF